MLRQARSLDQAEEMAREAIAAMLWVSVRSFDVRVSPDLPGGIGAEIQAAKELRQTAERAQREATAATRHVAATLLECRQRTMRDIGFLLGISHYRVSQLFERSRHGAA
ncbi:MAG: type II toxin-antitoxin system HicB family antitoxin [Candidatus Dormibacteria bacterium]